MVKITRNRCAFIFGQDMEPCPKCGSYNLKHQTPIKIDQPLPDDMAGIVAAWARARKVGKTLLEGPCYLCCFDCFHKGPAMDCSGRTAEGVGKCPTAAREIKRLWNEQEAFGKAGGFEDDS